MHSTPLLNQVPAWLRWIRSWRGHDLRVTVENLTVYQADDLATVSGLTRLQGTVAGGRFINMWARETNVLARMGGEWLVVHDPSRFRSIS